MSETETEPKAEKEATTRVTMIWPVALKDAVRDQVGARGLTQFVTQAVETALLAAPAPAPKPEIVKDVAVESPVEPVEEPVAPEEDPDDHTPMFLTKKPAPTPEPVAPEAPADLQATQKPELAPEPEPAQPGDPKKDLFKRIQAEGASLGIDLKPASEILKPEPKGQPEEIPAERAPTVITKPAGAPTSGPVCVEHPEMALTRKGDCYKCELEKGGIDPSPRPPAPAPEAVVDNDLANKCTVCGSELIDGECWECM